MPAGRALRDNPRRCAQPIGETIQSALGPFDGASLVGGSVHDQRQPALAVVEDRQFLGAQQHDFRCAELVGTVVPRQLVFDVGQRLKGEIADPAAGEGGQTFLHRHLLAVDQGLDFGQRVGDLALLDTDAIEQAPPLPAAHLDALARRQADDRIAPPGVAAFNRFQQIGVGAIDQLQVGRQRRIQIRTHMAHHRHTGVAGRTQLGEIDGVSHGAGQS